MVYIRDDIRLTSLFRGYLSPLLPPSREARWWWWWWRFCGLSCNFHPELIHLRLDPRSLTYVPWSKVAILGMGDLPPLIGNPYNGYINPYYWVDDHPLLYGNIGSLDPGTYSPPEKWWLQDDPFLLGFGNFSGAMLNFGRVPVF